MGNTAREAFGGLAARARFPGSRAANEKGRPLPDAPKRAYLTNQAALGGFMGFFRLSAGVVPGLLRAIFVFAAHGHTVFILLGLLVLGSLRLLLLFFHDVILCQ